VVDPDRLRDSFLHTAADGTSWRIGDGPAFAALASLPDHVASAFVAAEDARFFRHHGFDLHQIERSLAVDLREGRLLRGGSTISQQLVKNLFLGRQRTLARKFQEAVLTWRIEANLSKPRILEIYLNLIELGPGIYGVAAAARHWFGVEPRRLTLSQAAFLAGLTPAPTTLSRRLREAGRQTPEMQGRVEQVLRAMRQNGSISRDQEQRALREPLALPALARVDSRAPGLGQSAAGGANERGAN